MIVPKGPTENKEKRLYFRCIVDFLKNNNHRIASHTFSRTDGPLASRSDFKKIIPLLKADSPKVNILSLDGNSVPSVSRILYSEELTGHVADDQDFQKGVEAIKKMNFKKSRFLFVTNGIIFPELVKSSQNVGIPVDFIETRFEPLKVHKVDDHKIYLRNVISRMRRLEKQYSPSDHTCECGSQLLKGKYVVSYWEKDSSLEYFICPSCGIQMEDPGNLDIITNFVQGLN